MPKIKRIRSSLKIPKIRKIKKHNGKQNIIIH